MCEHVFVSTEVAFHDRLLELVPVYTEAGQRLVKLGSSARASADQAVAYALADRACRSWLRGAIPPSADMLDAIAWGIENLDPVTDPSTAIEAVEIAAIPASSPSRCP